MSSEQPAQTANQTSKLERLLELQRRAESTADRSKHANERPRRFNPKSSLSALKNSQQGGVPETSSSGNESNTGFKKMGSKSSFHMYLPTSCVIPTISWRRNG